MRGGAPLIRINRAQSPLSTSRACRRRPRRAKAGSLRMEPGATSAEPRPTTTLRARTESGSTAERPPRPPRKELVASALHRDPFGLQHFLWKDPIGRIGEVDDHSYVQ